MTKAPARFPLGLERMQRTKAASDVLRPQRPLHEAARDAARQSMPSGLGLDSPAVRKRMAERLRAEGIRHEGVLNAFVAVPRHRFVDSALANQAYEDTSLPIGHGQTISKPSVVARMLALLHEGDHAAAHGHLGRVLEIGSGCGYQTALLALLARHVRLIYGDGRNGHAPQAPYDAIIAAAGGEALPAAWTDQLAEGGRLVAPMHDAASGGQVLLVVDKRAGVLHRRLQDPVHFVPLKSGTE
jgi:protein-L-isoaspartate(D-aspartate) O-methyltransferase